MIASLQLCIAMTAICHCLSLMTAVDEMSIRMPIAAFLASATSRNKYAIKN